MTPRRTLLNTTTLHGTLAALLLLFGSATNSARGEEEFQRFLGALRDRGMADVALDYLARMRESRLISDETRAMIPYEEGVTLVAAAVGEGDTDQKTRHLDAARERFTEFAAAQPDHPLAASAESQLGNILVERARTLLAQAERPTNANRKDQLTAQAQELFAEAEQVFVAAEEKFLEQLRAFPKLIPQSDREAIAARDQARNNLLQARLFAGQAMFESAKAQAPGSAEAKKLLESAAAKFNEIYDKYKSRLVGLVARVKEGQCYQELGDDSKALQMYGDLLLMPDEPDELRRLKMSALRNSMQIWTSDRVKKYDDAITQGRAWLDSARGLETNTPDGLAVQYELAVALQKKAASFDPKNKAEQRPLIVEARKLAKQVAAFSGPQREPAEALFRELAGVESSDDKPPADFAEARDRGKEALDAYQALTAQLQLSAALPGEDLEVIESQADETLDRARGLFHTALELRDESTEIDDVNLVRYYLCYLYFTAEEYLDAAVIGEFLARRYPDSTGARKAGLVALASYLQMANAAAGEGDFEQRKMLALADFMTRRWAGEPEADDVWSALIVMAGQDQDADKVVEYLSKIPETSSRRADAELKAGQSLWAAYLRSASQDEEDRPPQAELDQLLAESQQVLEKGLERMKSSGATADVDAALASAALSLAQIYVGADQDEKALQLLTDERIGPLTLVQTNHPIAQQGNFATETYKLALRAFVATQALDKAEAVMQQLESSVGASDSDALTRIYVTLGRELEQQLALLRNENKEDQVRRVSEGFELFLDKIANRPQGNTISSLNWVAETYASLASGYSSSGGKLPASARAYLDKSLATDRAILERAENEEGFASEDVQLLVRLRMARNQRRAGDYRAAIGTLSNILKDKQSLLDAQVEAARTLQEWGKEKPDFYSLAVAGAGKARDASGRESKLIWGWARLASMTGRHPKYKDQFFDARYNMAKCRLLQGVSQSGAEKEQSLRRAESDVLLTARLHPDMSGDWRDKYDRLLKVIQEKAGRPVTGLPGAKSKKTPPTPSTAKR